jgi:trimethylamine--corrinoid protein Co-methyltransferase
VDDDTLAMHIIREVGLGGAFITHEHTVKHCRSGEIWYPSLLDRSAVGAAYVDPYEKAHVKADGILESHRPRVDGEVRKDLESLVSSRS